MALKNEDNIEATAMSQEILDKADAFDAMKTDFENLETRVNNVVAERDKAVEDLSKMTAQRDKCLDEIEIKDEVIEQKTREIDALREQISSGDTGSNVVGEVVPTREFDEDKFNEFARTFISPEIASSQYGRTSMKLVKHTSGNFISIIATTSVGANDEIITSGTVKTIREKAVELIKKDFPLISDVKKAEIKYIVGFVPSI